MHECLGFASEHNNIINVKILSHIQNKTQFLPRYLGICLYICSIKDPGGIKKTEK